MKEKKQSHKNYKTKKNIYIYEVCFKNRVFCKVIVCYKNEKGVIEDLKIKKFKN